MNFNKRYIIFVIGIFILILVGVYMMYNSASNLTDAQKFKQEYEKLNGTVNEKNNQQYRHLNIAQNNIVKYITAEALVTKMANKETFVVYFGFATCPWCRSVITTLLKVADDYKLDKIYYVDIENIRDIKEVDKNNNIITKKSGTLGYYQLLEKCRIF